MSHIDPMAPLEITRRFEVPLREVSLRLGITQDWLRRLARDPRHAWRIRVAELRVVLEREQLALTVEHLINEVQP